MLFAEAPQANPANAVAPPPGSVVGRAAPARGPHGLSNPHRTLDAEALIRVALQHQQEARTALALQTLDEAIARYDRHGELRAVRGSMLLSTGQVARALKDLELAAKWQPDDPAVLTNGAQAYRAFGREKEALTDLDRALALNPNLLAARFNRGVLLHAGGDYQGALVDFDHCVAVAPHLPAAYFNRASIYDALGRREEAIADVLRFRESTDNLGWIKTADELLKAWGEGSSPASEVEKGTASEEH